MTLAHLIGRTHSRILKFDPKNLTILCLKDHRYFTDHDKEWDIFWRNTFKDRIPYLDKFKNIISKDIYFLNTNNLIKNVDSL